MTIIPSPRAKLARALRIERDQRLAERRVLDAAMMLVARIDSIDDFERMTVHDRVGFVAGLANLRDAVKAIAP